MFHFFKGPVFNTEKVMRINGSMNETKLNAIDICWFERLLPAAILIMISVWGQPDDENEDQKRIKVVVKRILFAIRLYNCYCNNHCSASDHDKHVVIVVQNSIFQTDHNPNNKKYSSKKIDDPVCQQFWLCNSHWRNSSENAATESEI